jgi:hypothetical protein
MKSRGIVLLYLIIAVFAASSRAAPPIVVVKKVDESIATGTLTDLSDGKIVLTSPDARISLDDLSEMTFKSGGGAVSAPATARKLTGKVIGTEGSYNDEGNTRDKAFDGDLQTYFDAPNAHGDDAWVGLDLGSPKVITEIKYAPRSDKGEMMQQRMVGGVFQGSSSADFRSKPVNLAVVKEKPQLSKFTSVTVTNNTAFRYVRFLSPKQGIGNVAEIEFWGHDASAVVAPEKKSTGKPPATRPASTAKPIAAATTPTTAGTSIRVMLADAEQLNGAMLGWSEKAIRIATPFSADGGLDVPVDAMREMWKGTPDEVKKAKALSLADGPEDAAFVIKDNDVVAVRGIVLGIEGDALRFKFNDEEKKINLSKLVGVILGGNADKRDRSFRQTIQFSNGDALSGQWHQYDPASGSIGLRTAWGASLSIPVSQIARIRSTNGRLVYLSDLKPAAVEQTPYFDRILAYRVDKSLVGGPLKLSDGEYAHGVAVHSRTVLTYDLDGTYEELKTKIGFQQPEGKLGQAIVRVLGDGKPLYENLDARGDQPPVDVSVKVSNVRRLTLEVDFGKNEDTGDRVVWANARLLRTKK